MDSKSAREIALSLLAEDYKTAKEEVGRAFTWAQSIMGWSFAAVGVLFGAGVVAATSSATTIAVPAALAIFGLFVPALVWASALTWLGELIREERAAAYLRWLEFTISERPEVAAVLGHAPARYFLAATRKGLTGEQPFSSVGTAAVFFVTSALSDSMFFVEWRNAPHTSIHTTLFVAAIVVEVGGIAASFFAGWRLLRLRHMPYNPQEVEALPPLNDPPEAKYPAPFRRVAALVRRLLNRVRGRRRGSERSNATLS